MQLRAPITVQASPSLAPIVTVEPSTSYPQNPTVIPQVTQAPISMPPTYAPPPSPNSTLTPTPTLRASNSGFLTDRRVVYIDYQDINWVCGTACDHSVLHNILNMSRQLCYTDYNLVYQYIC